MLAESLVLDVLWLFGEEDHDEEGQKHHCGGEAVDMLPSEVHGETRGEESGEGSAAVAGSGYSHGKAFILLGEPAGTEGECDTEAGTGDAKQNSHGEDVVIRLDEEKTIDERNDNRRHLYDRCPFSADILREHAKGEAHKSPSEGGDGDH